MAACSVAGKRAFCVTESDLELAEGKGGRVMCGVNWINSLRYILLCCVRPSVGGGFDVESVGSVI